MHSISKKTGGYTEYSIFDNEYGSCVKIVPEKGAMATGFNVKGHEIFYIDRQLLDSGSDIYTGGLPILFPTCGSLKNGSCNINGSLYKIPEHGFAKSCKWDVDHISDDNNEIEFKLTDNSFTRGLYPFHFCCTVKYILYRNELKLLIKVVNLDKSTMPFCFGFHPFFNVKNKDALKFNIDASRYIDNNDGLKKDYSGKVDFKKPVDFIFKLNPSHEFKHEMIETENKYKIVVNASEEYKYMVLWTEDGRDFLCMEPWMGAPDALNTGDGIIALPPDGSAESWIKISFSNF